MLGKFSIVFKRKCQSDIAFCYVSDDKSKTVVSKNNEGHFEVLHVSRNADYVS